MKYYAQITRDIVRHISMGPLVVAGMRGGKEQEIAPPKVHEMPAEAGTVSVHKTKRDRDAYIAAINAEHPGAAEPYYLASART
jgi:hypothetical protein